MTIKTSFFALLSAALLGLAGAANATTVDLTYSACGFNSQGVCFILNNSGMDPAPDASGYLFNWNSAGSLIVRPVVFTAYYGYSFTGVVYTAELGVSPIGGFDTDMFAEDGSYIHVQGDMASRRTCTKRGRGQRCTVYVSFLGGTLTTPDAAVVASFSIDGSALPVASPSTNFYVPSTITNTGAGDITITAVGGSAITAGLAVGGTYGCTGVTLAPQESCINYTYVQISSDGNGDLRQAKIYAYADDGYSTSYVQDIPVSAYEQHQPAN